MIVTITNAMIGGTGRSIELDIFGTPIPSTIPNAIRDTDTQILLTKNLMWRAKDLTIKAEHARHLWELEEKRIWLSHILK